MARCCLPALLIVMLLTGCSENFKSEAEELSYLQALSNPTPSQWKRRNELAAASEAKELEDREKSKREYEALIAQQEPIAEKMWLEAKSLIGKNDRRASFLCLKILGKYSGTKAAYKASEAMRDVGYFEPLPGENPDTGPP
jgi:hypothetical protein